LRAYDAGAALLLLVVIVRPCGCHWCRRHPKAVLDFANGLDARRSDNHPLGGPYLTDTNVDINVAVEAR
jgi:hypothetical protein